MQATRLERSRLSREDRQIVVLGNAMKAAVCALVCALLTLIGFSTLSPVPLEDAGIALRTAPRQEMSAIDPGRSFGKRHERVAASPRDASFPAPGTAPAIATPMLR
jgi:hypothetical protein